MTSYQTYRDCIKDLPLPLAFVDLDNLESNAQSILQCAGNKPVRVVSKSLRSVDVIKHLLALSSQFKGVMCFHPEEAAFLASHGLDDLLVAYPSMQKAAIAQVCKLTQDGHSIVLMVDSLAHINIINEIASEMAVVQPVCMDIDMSTPLPGVYFGVRRSPIKKPEQAVALYQKIKQCAGVRLDGVMGYEAQIAGVVDHLPRRFIENAAIPRLKRYSIPKLEARRVSIVEALAQAGATLRFVNGGGTGSIASTKLDPSVTEIAVGSGFYSPHLFDNYAGFQYLPAAGFAVEVGRIPNDGYITCSGGGYIASGAVGSEKLPKPYLPEGLVLDANEGAGEVQTPLRYAGIVGDSAECAQLSPGDPVFFRHAKAGELCERFNDLVLVRNGEVDSVCATYRGHGKVFV